MEIITTKISGDHSGTWFHRKVALHLAQWLSPSFSIQVSNWLDELLLTGKVELGYEYNCKTCETKRRTGNSEQVILIKKRPENIPSDCKWCPKCEITLSVDKFCKASNRIGGYQNTCRSCYNINRKKSKLQNIINKQIKN